MEAIIGHAVVYVQAIGTKVPSNLSTSGSPAGRVILVARDEFSAKGSRFLNEVAGH